MVGSPGSHKSRDCPVAVFQTLHRVAPSARNAVKACQKTMDDSTDTAGGPIGRRHGPGRSLCRQDARVKPQATRQSGSADRSTAEQASNLLIEVAKPPKAAEAAQPVAQCLTSSLFSICKACMCFASWCTSWQSCTCWS